MNAVRWSTSHATHFKRKVIIIWLNNENTWKVPTRRNVFFCLLASRSGILFCFFSDCFFFGAPLFFHHCRNEMYRELFFVLFFCRVSVSPPQVDSFSIHFLKPSLRISPRDVRPHEANHLLLLLPLRNPQLIHSTSIQVRRRLRRVRWFNRHAISNEKQNQSTTAPTVDALATYERRLFFFLSSFFRWYFDL